MRPLKFDPSHREIILPFATLRAALENIIKIRKPDDFERITHRYNKPLDRWEVVLTIKEKL